MSSLENGLPPAPAPVPRASLVLPAGAFPGLGVDLWVGGAHTTIGHQLQPDSLADSLVVDCAGDLPVAWRTAPREWISCVFADIDGHLSVLERVRAAAVRAANFARQSEDSPGAAVYAICTHGMNRSSLVAGLMLRELRMSGADAVSAIQAARPFALSNLAFRAILLDDA